MTDLAADICIRFPMYEFGQSRPGSFMFGRVEAGATGSDPSGGGNAGHFREDQPRAAFGAFAVMDQMPVGRAAIDSLVLRHRRDDDPIFKAHVTQGEGREHRRANWGFGGHTCLILKPFFRPVHPVGIA